MMTNDRMTGAEREKTAGRGVSVLLVCMGNICRSPMAEGVLRKRLSDRAVDIAAVGEP